MKYSAKLQLEHLKLLKKQQQFFSDMSHFRLVAFKTGLSAKTRLLSKSTIKFKQKNIRFRIFF